MLRRLVKMKPTSFGATWLASIAALAFLPRYLQSAFCPRLTFISGYSGEWGTVNGLSVVLYLGCSAALLRDLGNQTNHWDTMSPILASSAQSGGRSIRPTVAVWGVLISLILWVCSLGSSYCLMPNRVLIHGPVFASSDRMAWDDVRQVTAWCQLGRYASGGGLNLLFNDDADLVVGLNYGQQFLRSDYDLIRSALAGHYYRYILSDSVTLTMCGLDAYTALTRFR